MFSVAKEIFEEQGLGALSVLYICRHTWSLSEGSPSVWGIACFCMALSIPLGMPKYPNSPFPWKA